MTDRTTIPTSTTTIRSKDGEDDGGDEGMGAEDRTATTTTTQLTGATATGRDMMTRGREMTQQPSKRTNKRTKNNQSGGGAAGEAATREIRLVTCQTPVPNPNYAWCKG